MTETKKLQLVLFCIKIGQLVPYVAATHSIHISLMCIRCGNREPRSPSALHGTTAPRAASGAWVRRVDRRIDKSEPATHPIVVRL
jgi:hypothetical protein